MQRQHTRRIIHVLAAATVAAAFTLGATAAVAEQTVIGRAVSVRGTVYALAENENPRLLSCRDPIYDGDTIVTEEDAAIGVDSSTYYVRLAESSRLGMTALASGSPKLDLALGHVRLIDSAGPGNPSAEVVTPALQVARTGPDLDAVVFGEKATAVSMVCAYGAPVDVARRGNDAEHLAAAPGSCVVGKPKEPLYAQAATHPMLAVLAQDACAAAGLPVAGLFSPTTVALGPPGGGGSGAQAPQPSLFAAGGLNVPCAPSCQPAPGGPPGLPTQFPFQPPALPVP